MTQSIKKMKMWSQVIIKSFSKVDMSQSLKDTIVSVISRRLPTMLYKIAFAQANRGALGLIRWWL